MMRWNEPVIASTAAVAGVLGCLTMLFIAMVMISELLRAGDVLSCSRRGLHAVDIPGRTVRMVCADAEGRLYKR